MKCRSWPICSERRKKNYPGIVMVSCTIWCTSKPYKVQKSWAVNKGRNEFKMAVVSRGNGTGVMVNLAGTEGTCCVCLHWTRDLTFNLTCNPLKNRMWSFINNYVLYEGLSLVYKGGGSVPTVPQGVFVVPWSKCRRKVIMTSVGHLLLECLVRDSPQQWTDFRTLRWLL